MTNSGNSGGSGGGGGVGNASHEATVNIINSTVSGNTAGSGGGIFLVGTVTIINTTVSGNTAGSGGGIENRGGTLNITNSSVGGNTAGSGGGISSVGTLTLANSSVNGNTASGSGGGIYNDSGTLTLNLTSSTVSGNTADQGGSGIWNSGTVELINSIIANNPSGDCSGTVSSLGHNLDGDGTCNLTELTDLPSTNPLMGPLQDYGGATLTHALLPGSPAIDVIPVVDCTDPGGNPITTDQRGVARPQGSGCDIGAFEAETAVAIPIPSVSHGALVVLAGVLATLLLWQRRRVMSRARA